MGPSVIFPLLTYTCCLFRQTTAQSISSIVTSVIKEEREFMNGPCDDNTGRERFDVVVVGAGAAGTVLARRLAEGGALRVLLLEAGDAETPLQAVPMMAIPARAAADWGYTTQPMAAACPLGPTGRCTYPLGKVMGGSSTTNFMMYVRGNAKDYDAWAEKGNPGWDYSGVLEYFKRSENMTIDELRGSAYHGTQGPLPISYVPFSTNVTQLMFDAADELGIPEVDYNGAAQEGISRVQTTTLRGERWSTNRAFLLGAQRLRGSALTVRRRSLVTRVLLDALTRRARGVRYERDGVTRVALADREVVLCAGAVNTPQLLMLSGVGPRKHLKSLGIRVVRNLPVGQGLVDHTMFLGQPIVLNGTVGPAIADIYSNDQNYVDYILNGQGPLTSPNGVEMLYFFAAGETPPAQPNMEMYVLDFLPFVNPANTPTDIYKDLRQGNAILPALVPLQPSSTGNVSLASTNIHDQPIIFPNFFGENVDINNAIDGIKKMLQLFNTTSFRRMGAQLYDKKLPGCEDFDFASNEYWTCALKRFSITAFNPCCTCRMGPASDPATVVGSDLRVHGLTNLRIVDASVFPLMTSGHTQAPALMVAEKAAELIKATYPRV